ncbi:hypothetical protein ACIPLC_33020 [Kitasatospora sp. NPDC086801]
MIPIPAITGSAAPAPAAAGLTRSPSSSQAEDIPDTGTSSE